MSRIGIPTEYRGVMFRSRLEARWARMFDALAWPWQYEPIDLNGYIPDFVLHFERPLLAEVKPALALYDMRAAEDKIDASGWNGEAVVLGADIWELHRASPLLGRIGEPSNVPGEERDWGEARLFFCCACQSVSIHAADGSWRCRRCLCDDGMRNIAGVPYALSETWFQAANEVQWMPADLFHDRSAAQ